MSSVTKFLCVLLSLLTALPPVYGQAPAAPPTTGRRTPVQPEVFNADAQAMKAASNYVLGPGDQIELRTVPESEELSGRNFRVDTAGNLTLPLVGAVKANGLTAAALEASIAQKLGAFIRNPQVTLTVTQFRTDPVLVTGMFAQPGIYPLQSNSRRLIEVLSTVGGLQANASRRIRITRRLENGPLPLPGAVVDEAGKVSTAEVSLTRLMETASAAENIELAPYDQLYAGKAEMVYLNIEGVKAGAYPLDERDYLSVVQLISLAGGMTQGLSPEKAQVLRPILNTSRRAEIPLDVKAILEGKKNDYPLMPNDLLVIPRTKSLGSKLARPLAVAVPALLTSLIWITIRNR